MHSQVSSWVEAHFKNRRPKSGACFQERKEKERRGVREAKEKGKQEKQGLREEKEKQREEERKKKQEVIE